MMKKILSATLAIGIAAATVPTNANATCSTGSFQVCASITAFYAGNGNLVLRAWNLFGAQGVGHVMTFVGIGSANWTGTATLVAARFNGSTITTWRQVNGINQNPVGAQMDFAGRTQSGITNGLVGCGATIPPGLYISSCNPPSGPYLELEFTTSSTMDLSTAVTGWHSQAVDGATCSLWVDSNGNTVGSVGNDACVESVPEPVTTVLLGTGLFGTGLAARRRRKAAAQDG